MKQYVLISLLVLLLASLACASSAASLPSGSAPTDLPTVTVVPSGTTVATVTVTATNENDLVAVTAERALNVRKEGRYTSEILVTLLSGVTVEVIGDCSDGWVLIQFTPVDGVGTGWVNADYLSGDICPK